MTPIRSKLLLACTLAAALAFAGCARVAPMVVMNDVPVTPSTAKALSAAQVRTAIITAGTSLGWRIADAGSGTLEGTLALRGHTAVVSIPYSASKYSIQYKRSENLMEGNGTIHNNYNGWVQNLDRAIRTEISRL